MLIRLKSFELNCVHKKKKKGLIKILPPTKKRKKKSIVFEG